MNKLSHKIRQLMKLVPSMNTPPKHPEITPDVKPAPKKTDFEYEFVFTN